MTGEGVPAETLTTDRCGCTSHGEHLISVRVGSVECRYCHKQICNDCCLAVAVPDSPMPEFRCHPENRECEGNR